MKRTVTKKNMSKVWQIGTGLVIIILLLIILLGVQKLVQTEEKTMTNKNYVTISTSKGDIVIALNKEAAPQTVANFQQYVEADFYNGTVFHRIIDGFMIQGGGFTPDGIQKQTNPPVVLEANLSNDRGTIAMARTNDPHSATSQFFINHVDNAFLNPSPNNPGYTVFGKVVRGMDVVDTIAKVQTSTNPMPDWPVEEILIKSVTFGGETDV